ncbi:MAG TPA: ABC transporter ATP-binding protein [Synergistales bacterium]|nr:ABC transporter ATP-binding protein [Synergistaceae bacterium]HPE65064.1 ABC transporter ATP-binding protein [Synergistales bacterium]
MSSVTIRQVTKSFGSNLILSNFDETFKDGEFVTLLGPSGCGKTTMLRMIAGFEKPTTGEIYIDDTLISSDKVFLPPEKRGVGMVFQSYAVWPHMDVFHNVAYPLTIAKKDRASVERKVAHVLDIVHLSQYAKRYPNQLSGGQQQRVALARALVAEPKLLLLDEPLSNLDAKLRESMRFEIKEIQRNLGITVVYVTHDQTEAMAMSDRVFLINRGVVQQKGTPEEIYRQPVNQFVADFLGKVDFIKGEAGGGRILLHHTEVSLPYAGDKTGAVEVAIRPENITMSKETGDIEGTVTAGYYLGDAGDYRVAVGGISLRVITEGRVFREFTPGDKVFLSLDDFIVYDDDGSLEEQLKINT